MVKTSRGGRRSGANAMSVPYEEWGKEIDKPILDGEGNTIGYIEDETRYVYEDDIRKVTKKEILNDIDGWRNDDGTYGNEDTSILLVYEDGAVVDVDDLNGKRYKKAGIIGASVTTGDYEMVWGEEYVRRNGRRERVPIQTFSEDGESGLTNSYSGVKATGAYKVRVRTTYNNPNGRGGYKTERQTIRKSTVKPLNW